VKAQAEGEFWFTDCGLIFLAKTHYMALVIKLLAVSAAGRLRKCLNPGCPYTPYFIADHGKTQYCSVECGQWGQRQAKLKYWHENKQTKQTSAQAKGNSPSKTGRRVKDGTHKAR
jgi:predicted RNA-binding Zn ribbon-like protein